MLVFCGCQNKLFAGISKPCQPTVRYHRSGLHQVNILDSFERPGNLTSKSYDSVQAGLLQSI